MAKHEGLNLGAPYPEQHQDPSIYAELSESDKAALAEQISEVSKESVLVSIEHFLARPEVEGVEKTGGEYLAKYGFAELILGELLILENIFIKSQKEKVVAQLEAALDSNFPAGEEITQDRKEKLAEDIQRIIASTIE